MSTSPVAPWMHHVQHPAHRPERCVRPASVDDALDLLAELGDRARLIAGGTDLMVELDRRVRTPKVLVDLTGIAGLDALHLTGNDAGPSGQRIELGALVTHNQAAVSELVRTSALPLAQAALEVGSPALRNRATIVGNVVTASPANDTISALRALGTDVLLRSTAGARSVDLADFHTGVRQSALSADELVTGLSVRPLRPDDRGVYLKLGLRRAQAISVVHLAIVLRVADGVINEASIAVGSIAPTIVAMPDAERHLEAQQVGVGGLDDGVIDDVADMCQAAASPITDTRATADHRHDQVGVMVRRALAALRDGAEADAYPRTIPVLGGPSVAPTTIASDVSVGGDVSATVNGVGVAAPSTGGTMLDWLRDGAELTGTKEGCAEGECGACTVMLDGVAVLSCLVPDARADGATIVTIEGLAAPADAGDLHPMQQHFIDQAAVQCGYCIPGFVMAAAALQPDEAGDPAARKLGLSGNLCRCTGYYAIERAVALASGDAETAS